MSVLQIPEIHRHQPAHARFLHGYTIDHIHGAHRHLVVRNDDKLGIFTELTNHIGEFAHIGIIQRGIHFIEYTEWRGFDQVDREQ